MVDDDKWIKENLYIYSNEKIIIKRVDGFGHNQIKKIIGELLLLHVTISLAMSHSL